MIKKIYIGNIATYIPGVEFEPKKINFIYGANGTGKSTLSKVLSNEISSSECNIEWNTGTKEDVIVYNKDFVEKNFQNDIALKGIFSMGEENIEKKKDIEEKKNKIEELRKLNDNAQSTIHKFYDEQKKERNNIEDTCWYIQKQYGEEFKSALTGSRSSKRNFCDKCIEVYKSLKEDKILSLEELRTRYKTVFAKDASKNNKYLNLPINEINLLDTNELLGTMIVGKSDTPIGRFIEYLNSSDWVKLGVEYAKKVDGKCPYCQRELPLNIQEDIEAYFDKTYEENKSALNEYEKKYKLMVDKIKKIIQDIEQNKYAYIDYTEFDNKKILLLSKLEKNQQIIQSKLESLSKVVEIESINVIASDLNKIIDQFNIRIEQNNELVKNQKQEKEIFKNQLWDFLVLQRREDIRTFMESDIKREKGKNGILLKINNRNKEIKKLKDEIEKKESSFVSIKPTVEAINKLLKNFGFSGFKIEVNEEKNGTYKIIRPSGEEASKTLSEGEYNFISFLYFYYLCFGSQEKTKLGMKKILVIDDPVSSMDSNVLFIVATLVKDMAKKCKYNKDDINQIFILTHNVYFHKEITFWGNKEALPSKETRYYVLKKIEDKTTIKEYEDNPIKTSYELLWKEIKDDNIGSANILMNIMRRILEHYFMVIGSINYEKCINEIDGSDKIICKSLVSLINEGSHSVFDDFIFTPDDSDIENYKRVFRLVFEKLGHIDHYNMMMDKIDSVK